MASPHFRPGISVMCSPSLSCRVIINVLLFFSRTEPPPPYPILLPSIPLARGMVSACRRVQFIGTTSDTFSFFRLFPLVNFYRSQNSPNSGTNVRKRCWHCSSDNPSDTRWLPEHVQVTNVSHSSSVSPVKTFSSDQQNDKIACSMTIGPGAVTLDFLCPRLSVSESNHRNTPPPHVPPHSLPMLPKFCQ